MSFIIVREYADDHDVVSQTIQIALVGPHAHEARSVITAMRRPTHTNMTMELEVNEVAVFADDLAELLSILYRLCFQFTVTGCGLATHMSPLLTTLAAMTGRATSFIILRPGASSAALIAAAPTWDDARWDLLSSVFSHDLSVDALLEIAAIRNPCASLTGIRRWCQHTALRKYTEIGWVDWSAVRASREERVTTHVLTPWMELDLVRARGASVHAIIFSVTAHCILRGVHLTEKGTLWACGERLEDGSTLDAYGLDDDTRVEYRAH